MYINSLLRARGVVNIIYRKTRNIRIKVKTKTRKQVEPCDENFIEKCPCFHHNNTTMIKQIPLFDKLPK